MIQSLKNAVNRFVTMGVITRTEVQVKKNLRKTLLQLSDSYREDNDKIAEIYEQVIFCLPYSPGMNLPKILAEIRALLVSNILPLDPTYLAKL